MLERRLEMKHHSRELYYRCPQGALKCGETVTLRLSIPNECGYPRLRVWALGGEEILEGSRDGGAFTFEYTAPKEPCLVWYYFIVDTPEGRRYYGGRTGEGREADYPPTAYQITVYHPSFKTPSWFGEGIIYQIFPDRFRRGGERGGLDRVEYHTKLGRRALVHEGWDEDVLHTPLPQCRDYDPCDYFGGDLEGIIEKLPYLKSLGVTCLYLNPVFEAASNHRYNTADYKKIDPVLGSEEDFRRLSGECQKLGIRVMLDGVFSHTGDDSVYFNRYGRYGGGGAYRDRGSPYYSWYRFTAYPDSYRSWWGFETLPEVDECDETYQKFISTVLKFWRERGASGWRLDVADELPDEFIAMLRRELKKLDENSVLLGEVWEEASNKQGALGRRKYVDGFELDSVMNYPFRDAVIDFFLFRTDAVGLNERLAALWENYPPPFYMSLMNLLGSHDSVRILTALGGAPHRDALTREEQAKFELDSSALERGRKRVMLATLIQMAMPGAPCIYYGDEAGMTGMADPFNRRTYPWGREDKELLKRYRQITAARTRRESLRKGDFAFAPIGEDVFVVARQLGRDSVIVAVNRSSDSKEAAVSADLFREGPFAPRIRIAAQYEDIFSGVRLPGDGGTVRMVLPPLSGTMLLS